MIPFTSGGTVDSWRPCLHVAGHSCSHVEGTLIHECSVHMCKPRSFVQIIPYVQLGPYRMICNTIYTMPFHMPLNRTCHTIYNAILWHITGHTTPCHTIYHASHTTHAIPYNLQCMYYTIHYTIHYYIGKS